MREGCGQLYHGGDAADACQIGLRLAQGFLGTLAFLGVDGGSVPFDDVAGIIAEGDAAGQPPAVIAVGPAQADFYFGRLASGEGRTPLVDVPGKIIRMNYESPIPAQRVLHGQAGSFQPRSIDEINGAISAGCQALGGYSSDDGG